MNCFYTTTSTSSLVGFVKGHNADIHSSMNLFTPALGSFIARNWEQVWNYSHFWTFHLDTILHRQLWQFTETHHSPVGPTSRVTYHFPSFSETIVSYMKPCSLSAFVAYDKETLLPWLPVACHLQVTRLVNFLSLCHLCTYKVSVDVFLLYCYHWGRPP